MTTCTSYHPLPTYYLLLSSQLSFSPNLHHNTTLCGHDMQNSYYTNLRSSSPPQTAILSSNHQAEEDVDILVLEDREWEDLLHKY